MLQAIEILCTDEELDAIDTFVEENEICTIDIEIKSGKDGAQNVVRMQSFWLSQSQGESEDSAERKRWSNFVQQFHQIFGY